MASSAKQHEIDSSIRRDLLVSALQPLATALIRADKSAGVLIRAAKMAYLLAALAEIRARNDRPNVSKLSVVTGMTRKEIAALLSSKLPSGVLSSAKQMEHRALRVVMAWRRDPLYAQNGRTCELQIRGAGRSFTALARTYAGDVPVVSVLRELERMNAVRRMGNGSVRLRPRISRPGVVTSGRLDEFTRMLADFSATAAQLVSESEPQNYLGFKEVSLSDERQIARFKEAFGRRAATLLESVEIWTEPRVRARRNDQRANKSRRVGVGVYFVDAKRAR